MHLGTELSCCLLGNDLEIFDDAGSDDVSDASVSAQARDQDLVRVTEHAGMNESVDLEPHDQVVARGADALVDIRSGRDQPRTLDEKRTLVCSVEYATILPDRDEMMGAVHVREHAICDQHDVFCERQH